MTKNQENVVTRVVYEDKSWAEIWQHSPGTAITKDNFFTEQKRSFGIGAENMM
jgi:hypothetical protein